MTKLIFLDRPIEAYKSEIFASRHKQFVRLYDECQRRIRQQLKPTHPAMSTTFMGITILNLSLMYLLTNEEKYLVHAKRWMLTVCNYQDWGYSKLVNVDLSASWILFGLSIGYDWLKPYLDDQERKIITDKLLLQAEIMYQYKVNTEGEGWSTQYYQNHNWINMTGLATAGYALKDEFVQTKKYIEISKDNFEKVYRYLADDGSNYEGVAYWRYGGMWLFVYAHLLKTEEKIDYFRTCEYLKNTFYYRLYQSTGNMLHPLDFGDCHDYYSSHTPAIYYKIASEYQNGYAQEFGNLVLEKFLYQEALESHVKPGILFEAGLEFLWYNPSVLAVTYKTLPTSRFFPDLGLLYLRNSWDEEATVFSIKCGYPGGKKQWLIGWKYYTLNKWKIMSLSHHHPDNNSFLLNRRNFPLIIDDGYNREILPDHHNGILVDGKIFDIEEKSDIYMHSIYHRIKTYPDYNPSQDYHGSVKLFETGEDVTIYQGETHLIYQPSLKMKKVTRTIVTNNLEYLIIVDHVESSQEHEYTLVTNTSVVPHRINNQEFDYIIGTNRMKINVFSNQKLTLNQKANHITTIFTPQEPDIIKSEYLQSIQLTTAQVKKASFFQVISYEDLDNPITLKTTDISENEYIGIRVKDHDWVDYYFEGKINHSKFVSDAKHLYIRYRGLEIEKVMMIDGSYLEIDQEKIINNKSKSNIFRRFR